MIKKKRSRHAPEKLRSSIFSKQLSERGVFSMRLWHKFKRVSVLIFPKSKG